MSTIPANFRQLVIDRAFSRCEYCGLSQQGQEAEFHIDHITPRARRGETVLGNLALTCVSCSLRKAARVSAIDPLTNRQAPLFHPRENAWDEHFCWEGVRIAGLTPTGRATVDALQMNRPLMLAIREEEKLRGRHPE